MTPQTTIQILRCWTLGRYTALVEGDELRIRGAQPLAGPLPASIKARREELIEYLAARCGGVWPPAEGSELANEQKERREKRRRLPWRPAA